MSLTLLSDITNQLPNIAPFIAIVAGVGLLVWLALNLLRLTRLFRRETVCLEVIPPVHNNRSVQTASELFTALHGLGLQLSWLDKLTQPPQSITMEVQSTKAHGLRYMFHVAKDKQASLEPLIHAHIPDGKLRVIDQPATTPQTVVSFRQKKHYAFPLKQLDAYDQREPISYLLSAMANPSSEDSYSVQITVTPTVSHEAEKLSSQILDNEDLLRKLQYKNANTSGLLGGVNNILFGVLDGIGSLYRSGSKEDYYTSKRDAEYKQQVAKRLKPVRTLSYFEHELMESMHRKLAEPLFYTDIRVAVSGDSQTSERLESITSTLTLHNVPKYQGLARNKLQDSLKRRWLRYKFRQRLPSLTKRTMLSTTELAGLFHFPSEQSVKVDNVTSSLSKSLPAPTALKNGQKLGVVIGENVHHGVSTPIGLTDDERERHVYIIGGTGNGKTTMLMYSIVQDMKVGKGIAVLDPHGDLAETLLGYVPEDRLDDVIYLNPDDLTRPIGINLLELPPGLKGDELLREKDLITESAISVLRKIFSDDDSGGHRIEYVLRNAIQTALTIEGATLFTIFRLLNDTKYRQKIVRELEDNDLKIFWKNEIAKAGEMQKVKMAAGITSKIGRFLFSGSARKILEQEKSTISFEDIINGNKILICNFSKGLIGEDTSTLFGTTVLAKLQVAALRRARQGQASREPFYLYVDEFQNFATMSFVQMLSEARKYKLFLTMAEQSTQQQDKQRLVDIILANVGTVVCFRSGSPADERLTLPLFRPFIEEGEIANLPAYNFYIRIAAVEAREPLSGMMLLLDEEPNADIARQAVKLSRSKYGKKVANRKKIVKKKTKVENPKTERASIPNRPSAADKMAVARK